MAELLSEVEAASEKEVPKRKSQLVAALKAATPVDTGEARDGWHITKNGISNDVEHIETLNQGTSQQAPSYFVEKTLLSHRDVHPSGIIVRRK